MSKVIMGNGGFYGCSSEPQGVSAWWKETAQSCIRFSHSLLLNRLEPISSKAKLLLPIMQIGIVAYAFTLSWDSLCRNSCIARRWLIHLSLPYPQASLVKWVPNSPNFTSNLSQLMAMLSLDKTAIVSRKKVFFLATW